MKKIIFTAIAIFGLATITMAQVPNYVSTNGLVGWWPFNGNANDQGPNSINGTISGANFSTDRFSSLNAATSYYGSNDFIQIPTTSGLFNSQQYSISYWFKTNQSASSGNGGPNVNPAVISRLNVGGPSSNPASIDNFVIYEISGSNHFNTPMQGGATGLNTILGNTWHHIVFTVRTDSTISYLNGVQISSNVNSGNITFQSYPIRLGRSQHTYWKDFSGEIDDLGVWNRALSPQEVTDLYNASSCSNDLVITPQNNTSQTGGSVSFTATTSDLNPNFVWQSDFGQGFQTLNNFGNYSGVNSATLNIANVQLSEHNQPMRVISTSGNCIDTSNVAVINILDTCIVTINDTNYVTVTDTNYVTVTDTNYVTVTDTNYVTVTDTNYVTITDTAYVSVADTLIINATITGLTPPNNLNTIKVFPNPANSHITIDYGDFASMSGYTLKITNNLGQVVFTSPINQQTSYIDLSTWTGNGIYFVQIIDTQNNTIENRKIVIQ